MTQTALFVLLIAILVTPAVWALSVMGRSRVPRRDVEQPSADNNWQNEDYAEYEKGGKPRSTWVTPPGRYLRWFVPRRPIDW